MPRKVGLNLPDCGLKSGQSRRNGPVGDVESVQGDRHKSSKGHVETPPGAVLLGPRQEDRTGNVILTETTGFTAREQRGLGVETGFLLVSDLGHRQITHMGATAITPDFGRVQLIGKQRDATIEEFRTLAFGKNTKIGARGGQGVHGEHRVGVVKATG